MESKQTIELISLGFEITGVIVLVIGTLYAFIVFATSLLSRGMAPPAYQALRRDMGKAILMGLELLVAADIVRTIAIDPTFVTVGVLGLIVLIRTFLSWSLEVEINGTWPWQHPHAPPPPSLDQDER
jgi:uncharacterized membrane protein